MTSIYVDWGLSRVKLTWIPSKQPPIPEFITSVHGLCFLDNQLLLVDIKKRGWNFPGGHIELNETPLECVKREVMEEACVEGDCEYLGYVEVNHNENPNWKSNSPYPVIGYQTFYRMDITNVLPFAKQFESQERKFIPPNESTNYVVDWHEVYEEILQTALVHF
ncbi:MAG: NUDIX domain-containing protein [Paenisporosarcina sp.]